MDKKKLLCLTVIKKNCDVSYDFTSCPYKINNFRYDFGHDRFDKARLLEMMFDDRK